MSESKPLPVSKVSEPDLPKAEPATPPADNNTASSIAPEFGPIDTPDTGPDTNVHDIGPQPSKSLRATPNFIIEQFQLLPHDGQLAVVKALYDNFLKLISEYDKRNKRAA